MTVAGGDAVTVVHDYSSSIAAHEVGKHDYPVGWRHNGLTISGSDINAAVEGAFSVERVNAFAKRSRNGTLHRPKIGGRVRPQPVGGSRVASKAQRNAGHGSPVQRRGLECAQLVQGRNDLGFANVLRRRGYHIGVGLQAVKRRNLACQGAQRCHLDIPLLGHLLQPGIAILQIFLFGPQFVVMRYLQHHAQIGAGDPGQAHAHDRRTHQQHVEIMDGDMDLAQLTVVTACDKQDVEAFLQFVPFR